MGDVGETSGGISKNKFENILVAIRPFGKWQISIIASICSILVVKGFVNGIMVFLYFTPQFNCTAPGATAYSEDQCSYNVTDNVYGNWTEKKCTDWKFDTEVMTKTVVTEYDLVCDDKVYAAHGLTSHLLGYLFGATIGGYLSDRFGRKIVLVLGSLLCGIFGVVQAYIPNLYGILFFRFLTGLTQMAAVVAAFVLQNEVTTANYRALVGGTWMMYSIGYSLISVAALIFRDWQHALCVAQFPLIPLAIMLWFVLPESPRWLLSMGHVEKGEKEINRAAKCNGVALSSSLELETIASDIARDEAETRKQNLGILHVFHYRLLALRTMNIIFCWAVNSIVYYGLIINISDMSGDLFLNNALNGLVEVPCSMLLVPLTRWSRKKPLIFFLLFAGISLVIIPWIPNDIAKLTLALAGKFGITLTFNMIYVYTVELYPTAVRSGALGTCSMAARISGMLAPYISLISKGNPALKWIPMTIYGVTSTICGILLFFMPETAGKRMPETFNDALSL